MFELLIPGFTLLALVLLAVFVFQKYRIFQERYSKKYRSQNLTQIKKHFFKIYNQLNNFLIWFEDFSLNLIEKILRQVRIVLWRIDNLVSDYLERIKIFKGPSKSQNKNQTENNHQ